MLPNAISFTVGQHIATVSLTAQVDGLIEGLESVEVAIAPQADQPWQSGYDHGDYSLG